MHKDHNKHQMYENNSNIVTQTNDMAITREANDEDLMYYLSGRNKRPLEDTEEVQQPKLIFRF